MDSVRPENKTLILKVFTYSSPAKLSSADPYDPYDRSADPYNRSADPYDRSADPYDRSADPYDRSAGTWEIVERQAVVGKVAQPYAFSILQVPIVTETEVGFISAAVGVHCDVLTQWRDMWVETEG